MIGRTLAHYRILAELGRGGMGVVYRAEDSKLGREVALKVLPAELATDAERLARFQREARAAAALNHRNIVTLYSVEEADGVHFLTMELVEGSSLAELVPPTGLPLDRLLAVALPLTDALIAAHDRGVIHRDLKPGNVMVRPDGTTKVLDFGLARVAAGETAPTADAASSALTDAGKILGTTPYMAPEQLQGQAADARSDLFSLGVILYELATGQRPFAGTTTAEVISAVLRDPPRPLAELRADLPADLGRVIARCLEKDPARRYGSAYELRRDLDDLRRGLPLEPRTEIVALPSRSARRRTALLVAATLALAAGWWLWARAGKERPSPPAGGEATALRVAVLPFANRTGEADFDWLERGIADMVLTNLSQSRYLQVLGPEGLGGEAAHDASAALRAARVDVVVGGSVVAAGGRFRLLSQLQDLRSGEVLPSAEVEGGADEELLAAGERLAGQVRVALEVEAAGAPDEAAGVARTKTASLDAYRHYVLGREQLDRQSLEAAITELQQAVTLDPCFAHAYDLLANAHDVQGEVSLAKEAAARAVACADRLPEVERLRMLRRQAQLDEDIAAEAGYLERLVALQPQEAEWHFLLGWHVFTHRRACEPALREYRRAVELAAEARPHYYSYLAEAELACGDGAAALASYRRHVALQPADPYALINLGYGLFQTGAYDDALAQFAEAERLDPDFTEALLYRGDVLLELGRLAAARQAYGAHAARAATRNEQETAAIALARSYLEGGEIDRAAATAEEALASDPEAVAALWVQGLAAVAAGRLDAARAAAARIEAILSPTGSLYRTEMLHHLRAAIATADGSPAGAVTELEAAVALAPSELAFYSQALADAQAHAGDLAGARASYDRALASNPNHPASLLGLAALLERQGEPGACQRYRRLLTVLRGADPGVSRRTAAERGVETTCNGANPVTPSETEGASAPQGGPR